MPREDATLKSNILKLFSENVSRMLIARGLHQTDLAKGIGTDARNVSHWLRRKATPNAVWVAKIADFLDVSTDELYGRIPPGGDPMPQIRKHAQRIYTLAGGVQASPKKKRKKKSKGKKAWQGDGEGPVNRR